MVSEGRSLHLAGSQEDFEKANRVARDSGCSEGHWILSTVAPLTGDPASHLVEWIRLPSPDTITSGPEMEAWLEDLKRLAEVFSPDQVVIHRDFSGRWLPRIQDVLSQLPSMTVVLSVTPHSSRIKARK